MLTDFTVDFLLQIFYSELRDREKEFVGYISIRLYSSFLKEENELRNKIPAKTTEDQIDIDSIYPKLRRTIEKKYGFMCEKRLVLIPILIPSKPSQHFILITAVKVRAQDQFCSWNFVVLDSLRTSKLYRKPLCDIAELYER